MKTIIPYVGLNHMQDPKHDSKPTSKPLCGKNVEVKCVTKKNENECPTCKEIAQN